MKKCTKCHIIKDETEFYVDRRSTLGIMSSCKECEKNSHKSIREKYKTIDKKVPENKKCPCCNTVKSSDDFYKKKDVISGLSSFCKQCTIEKSKTYREQNLEKIRITNRISCAKYRNEKREKYLSVQHKYMHSENGKLTKNINREKRRTIKNNGVANLTVKQWIEILQEQNNKCNGCGREFNDKLIPEQDHILAVTKGGSYSKNNIQALCKSCNSSKGNKLEWEYK